LGRAPLAYGRSNLPVSKSCSVIKNENNIERLCELARS
jgi:hypothetical protein